MGITNLPGFTAEIALGVKPLAYCGAGIYGADGGVQAALDWPLTASGPHCEWRLFTARELDALTRLLLKFTGPLAHISRDHICLPLANVGLFKFDEKFFVRVDVTDEFPYPVTKLSHNQLQSVYRAWPVRLSALLISCL